MSKIYINQKGPKPSEFRKIGIGTWFMAKDNVFIKTTPSVGIDILDGLGIEFQPDQIIGEIKEIEIVF